MIPLSYAQRRLWFVGQLWGPKATYNVPITLHLSGSVDRGAVELALRDVVGRHEALRTVFPAPGGEPYQRVLPVEELDFGVVWSGVARGELDERIAGAAQYAFDLGAEIPVRVEGFSVGSDEYVLLLLLHHVACDGWSVAVLGRDLAAAYAARVVGSAPGWEALPVQYADFTLWQRELLGAQDDPGSVVSRQAAFWRERLAGVPEELALPFDRPRPAEASQVGAAVNSAVGAETHVALVALAREAGVTVFMVAQAVLAVLLTRLGAGCDIPLGAPVAGRSNEALEDLIGFFVNTLVLRTDTSGDPTFREVLGRVRQADLSAFENQDLPFERLVEILDPPRSLARQPLFQVMLTFDNNVQGQFDLAGLQVRELDGTESGTAKFDLVFSFTEQRDADGGPGGMSVEVEYATELFDRVTVEAMTARLTGLFRAVIADPDQRISAYEILAGGERDQVLYDWNATDRPLSATTVAALFEAQVARTPDAIAVIHGDTRLTYAQLDQRASRLARHLIALGAGPEKFVAIALPRTHDLIVSVLAVLKAGAAYVPIDPAYPTDRIASIISETRPCTVIATRQTSGRLPEAGIVRLLLDDYATVVALAALPEGDLMQEERAGLLPQHPAYVIFTSGSTGQPKGVVVPHQNVVNLAMWAASQLRGELFSRVLAATSLSFDVSVFEIFGTLLRGGSIEVVRDLLALSEGSEAWSGSLISAVPSVLDQLLTGTDLSVDAQMVVLAGEALSPQTMRTIAEVLPRAAVANIYGPTEATVYVSAWYARAGEFPYNPPIGRPLHNTRVFVLDEYLNVVPVGVAGELYVAGSGLARGYLNQSGLTSARFVACPYGGPGERMYRTGDLVRWTGEGDLEFLGRADEQVKVRGFRVELAEVESVLASLEGVARAAAMVREDQAGDRRLVGYVVPPAGGRADPGALREAVARVLPGFMVPAAIVVLEALPLSPNGKLDRRALPAPDYSGPAASRGPRSPREEILCGLFADVLHLPKVGIDDSFFTLGGHSLLATRLVSRAQSEIGLQLTVRDLFETPTVAGLVERFAQDKRETRQPLVPRQRPERVPLSYGQRRLWFIHKLEGPSPTYNVPLAVRLSGSLDHDALDAAMHDVVGRHEVLRTVFPEAAGEPHQMVLPGDAAHMSLEVVQETEGGLADALKEAAGCRIDISTETPLRAWLFTLAPDEHVLLVVIHHIATDGWSASLLLRELAAAYAARREGAAPAWEAPPVQYADYALWHRELLGAADAPGSVTSVQAEFWRAALEGLPEELQLPGDRPRRQVPSYQGGWVPLELNAGLHARLQELAAESGATVFMVLQAGLAALLSRLGAGHDIPIGTATAGRTDPALDHLQGFFANTLALRTNVSGNPSFRELLARVRVTDLAAYAHDDLPFERLVEIINPARSAARHPIFQVIIAYDDDNGLMPAFAGLLAESVSVGFASAKFDLELHLNSEYDPAGNPAEISGGIIYAEDLFNRSTARRIAGMLESLFRAAADNWDMPISGLSLVSPDERHQLLKSGTGPVRHGQPTSVTDLFREQAGRRPDAVAVTAGEKVLTYRDLDEKTDALARYLSAYGVGPEIPVGLFVGRGLEMIIGLLGILKAGGAYVALDPGHPVERIAFMLADSSAELVLTEDQLLDRLPASRLETICLDSDWAAIAAGAAALDDPAAMDPRLMESGTLAYIIYTSGSTGTPKGVAVGNRSLANYLTVARETYPALAANSLLYSSPTFDLTVTGLLGPLTAGGTVHLTEFDHIGEQSIPASGEKFFLKVTPSHLKLLSDRGALAPVCDLVIGGEELTGEEVNKWRRDNEETAICNEYGPTEATVGCTVYQVQPGARVDTDMTPIGRPIANTQVFVLDNCLQPVPAEMTGELYIAGAALARGYVGGPGLTSQRFVPCPFGAPGQRMYRTGDLVRWNGTNLVFVGRADEQVKIRGFRIEPGEVQVALNKLPGVAQSAVVVLEEHPGDKRLIGYVVPDPQATLQADALRGALEDVLPDYMIPSAVVLVDAIPLTAHGKLDKRALPAPHYESRAAGSREPRNQRQEALCALFAETLSVPKVAIDDSFFDLGGHSILAAALIHKIHDSFGVLLPVRALFERATVAGLEPLLGPGDDGQEEALRVSAADIAADITLDESIRPDGAEPPVDASGIEGVLLTGATGFVGSFLLRELLDRTHARVFCLVRAVSPDEAMERIQRSLEGYGLWQEELRARIVAVPGDLGRPLLGLTPGQFAMLAADVQIILHNGARVNHLETYEQLRPANVLGVQEIYRLAGQHRIKPVHFVSTSSTVVAGREELGAIPEDRVSDAAQLADIGYVQTKWVAEGIARLAWRRGLPTAIYRLTRVSGHSATGAVSHDDSLWHHVRACIELGAYPVSLDGEVDLQNLVPVDSVTQALAHLSLNQLADGRTYVIAAPEPISIESIMEHAHNIGYPLEAVSEAEWLDRLNNAARADPPSRPTSVRAVALLNSETERASVRYPEIFDHRNLCRSLAGTDIEFPPMTSQLLDRYFSYVVTAGFLPPASLDSGENHG